MRGIELLARREALGLSKPSMAETLNVRPQNLDRWEHGKNPPRSWDWIEEALTSMEDYQDQLIEKMVASVLELVEQGSEPLIMSYATSRSFYSWMPQAEDVSLGEGEDALRGIPVDLHRAAAAQAVRRLRREHQIDAAIEAVPASAAPDFTP